MDTQRAIRSLQGSGLGGSRKPVVQDSSNLSLLIIGAAFLVVTVGLIVMQPKVEQFAPVEVAVEQPEVVAEEEPVEEVTRAAASLLDPATPPDRPAAIAHVLPEMPYSELSSAAAATQRMQTPLRVTETPTGPRTVRELSLTTLRSVGYQADGPDSFVDLIVQAVTEQQSDAYIDALVNTAYAQGEIAPPAALLTLAGRVDVPALLKVMVMVSQGYTPVEWPATETDFSHGLDQADSLVGLALRYYRQPRQFARISQANGVLSLAHSHAPGDVIIIPAL